MKLLFLTPAYPWPLDSGWTQRFHHILEALTARHAVTLVSVDDDGTRARRGPSPIEERCAAVVIIDTKGTVPSIARGAPRARRSLLGKLARVFSPTFNDVSAEWCRTVIAALHDLAARAKYDAVWACQLEMAEIASRAGLANVIVDIDDVPSAIATRTLALERSPLRAAVLRARLARIRLLERLLPFRFWKRVVCKADDLPRSHAARRRAYVVPNGIDPGPVADDPAGAPGDPEVLFVGNLFHPPNVDGIRWFHAAIFPRIRAALPGARFVIAGKGQNPEIVALDGRDGVSVHVSPLSLEPFYARAALVVAPLRLGSGTKVKVLEALARAKAVVCTGAGAEGLALRPGVDVEIAEEPAAFADACVGLLRDTEQRRRLGRAGREHILARFSWTALADAIDRVVTDP